MPAASLETVGRTRAGRARGWRALASVSGLVLCIGVAMASLTRWEKVSGPEQGLLSVPPAQVVELGACGFDNLLADVFYMRFSTYWGYWLTHGRKFHNLYPLLDLITSLNPDFHPAYEVGALALADAGQTNLAVTLLNKGALSHPGDYWYPYQAGMMLFLYGRDYVLAARYFSTASHDPHADPSAAYFVARMFHKAHRRTDAIDEWIAIYLSGDKDMRVVAAHSLDKLFKIQAQWLDLYLSGNPLAHRVAGRTLLHAGVDLRFLDSQADKESSLPQ